MTLAHVRSFAFRGIEAVSVEVRAEVSAGLPAFTVAGLPGNAGKKARDRVRAALAAIGLSLPPRRVAVTLSPDNALGEGSQYDLPIAMAVLTAMGLLPLEELSGFAGIGALSPDGSLERVAGILPAAIAASGLELGLMCPASQGDEAAWAGSIEVLAAPDLLAIINHFRGTQVLSPPRPAGVRAAGPFPDLADLHGMETAKRALEIAAAGGYSLMLIGPPGEGKAALAACLPGLLPDLSPAEALEISMIHSVAGMLDGGRLLRRPPFRAPSSGMSPTALLGSGQGAGLGEACLAHLGVLFLDELSLFPPDFLGTLVQPPEVTRSEGCTRISQGASPPRFQLVAAMSPTGRHRLGDPLRGTCEAEQYRSDHSDEVGALIDRMDVFVHVQPSFPIDLDGAPAAERSAAVAERVRLACARRLARHGEDGMALGGDSAAAEMDCQPGARALAEDAARRLSLSATGLSRLLRVARTVADLGNSRGVRQADVAEALAYRLR